MERSSTRCKRYMAEQGSYNLKNLISIIENYQVTQEMLQTSRSIPGPTHRQGTQKVPLPDTPWQGAQSYQPLSHHGRASAVPRTREGERDAAPPAVRPGTSPATAWDGRRVCRRGRTGLASTSPCAGYSGALLPLSSP